MAEHRLPFARLVEIDTKRTFFIEAQKEFSIGRRDPRSGITPDIDLTEFDDERSVSRKHACIGSTATGEFFVVDIRGSMNGCYLNGVRIPVGKKRPLNGGDFIAFGLVGFRFRLDSQNDTSAEENQTVPMPTIEQASVAIDPKSRFAFGINDNIEIAGRVLHIQTEDLGKRKQEILTIVYSSGSILFSKSSPYEFFTERIDRDIKPAEMVRFQHRGITTGLKRGKLKGVIP